MRKFLWRLIALVALCSPITAHAEALRLPVSDYCKNAQIQTGTWYAVRKPTASVRMTGLRLYYRHTLKKREGNIFGSDYCTFERHLVYANQIGAHGRPVNDRMTNLSSQLLLPVKPEYGTQWICFRPDPEHDPECKSKPGLVAAGTLQDGTTMWGTAVGTAAATPTPTIAAPETPKTSRREVNAGSIESKPTTNDQIEPTNGVNDGLADQIESLRMQITEIQISLKALPAMFQQREATLLEKTKQLTEKQFAEQSAIQKGQFAALDGKIAKLIEEETDRANASQSNDNRGAVPVVLGALSAILVFVIYQLWRRPYRRNVPEELEEKTEVAVSYTGSESEQIEPGDYINIAVPQEREAAGLNRTYEVYMKTKGRGGVKAKDPYDYWVLPDHTQEAFQAQGMSREQMIERVLEKPRDFLIISRNLQSHWNKCGRCRQILVEERGVDAKCELVAA